MSNDSKLAAVYGRVSTDMQGDSLDGQDAKCLAYLQLKGLQTGPGLVFRDEDVSGGVPVADRPGGRQLFQVLTHGWAPPGQALGMAPSPVKHLVVAKLDRLGRNAENMLNVWRWAKDHGVTLHIVDMGGESITNQGYAGKLMFGIMSMFAEFEREMIRDRVTQGIRRKFERQECIGTCPYGYDLVGTGQINPKTEHELMRLEDNLGEQLWVRKMAGWRAQGMGWGKIASTLNSLGVPTKTRQSPWQAGNVKGVLESRHTARLLANAEPEQEEPQMNADEPQERKAA
jgi:DNA invertase Pin-like site-specific DNA recombinase